MATTKAFELGDLGTELVVNADGTVSSLDVTTDSIAEGSSNLYHTTARARAAISVSGNLTYDSGTGVLGFVMPTTIASLSNHDTDDLAEGISNLYFTSARARSSLTGSNGITYNSSTGDFELTDSGVTADTYGSASQVPVITVDAKGRITSASTTAVAGVSSTAYDTSTGVLTINTSDGGSFTEDLGVGTGDSPTFAGLDIDGSVRIANPSYYTGTYHWTLSQNVSSGYFAINYFGQSDDFIIRDNGNIGIGTASPSEQLHLSRVTYPTIKLSETTLGSHLLLQTHSVTAEHRLTGTGAYPLVIKTNDIERIRIDSSGNVGIGSSSPTATLQIKNVDGSSSDTTPKLTITGGYAGDNKIMEVRYNQDAGSMTLGYAGLTGDRIVMNGGSSNAGSSISLYDGTTLSGHLATNANNFVCSAGNNFGVGTANPLQKFSVKGRANFDSAGDYYGAWVDGNSSGTSWFAVGSWYNNGGRMEASSSNLDLYTHNTGHDLTLQKNGGQVAINRTSADYTLDVNGLIRSIDGVVTGIVKPYENSYPLTVGAGEQWIKIADINAPSPTVIRFTITTSGDNTQSKVDFTSVSAGYSFEHSLEVDDYQYYNSSRLLEVATYTLSNTQLQIWAKVKGNVTSAGSINVLSDRYLIGSLVAGTPPADSNGTAHLTNIAWPSNSARPSKSVSHGITFVNGQGDGTGYSRIHHNGSALAINQEAQDVDLQVKASGVDYALFVQGSSGNVGIGTNTPNSELELLETYTPTLSLSTPAGGGTSGGVINFRANSHTQPIQAQIKSSDAGDYRADIIFSNKATTTGGVLSEKFRIHRDGNVGIGTTTGTAYRLDVNSGTTPSIARFVSNATVSSGNQNTMQIYTTGMTGGTTGIALGKTSSTKNTSKIIYGHSADGSNSNWLGLGFWDADNLMVIQAGGNVGINDTTPSYKLDVNGAIRSQLTGSSGGYRLHTNSGITASANYMNFFTSQTAGWRFNANGTGADTDAKLTIDLSGNATFAGDVTANSDVRLKSDIQTISNALDTVKALRGTAYIKDGKASIGVIAQEIEEVLPQVVSTADDEMGTKSVAYGNIVAVLIEAIKEQQEQIDELKKLLEAK